MSAAKDKEPTHVTDNEPKPLGKIDFHTMIQAIAAAIKVLTEAGMSGTEAGKMATEAYFRHHSG